MSLGQTPVPLQGEEKKHRRQIADGLNRLISYLRTEPLVGQSYTVATLPTASSYEGGIVYVSDETGGAVMAFSDGADWRRTTDRAVVS